MNDTVGQKLSLILRHKLPFELVLKIVDYIEKCYKCKVCMYDKSVKNCTSCKSVSCKKHIEKCFDCGEYKCKPCVKKEYLPSMDYIRICAKCFKNPVCKICNNGGSYSRCIECNVNICGRCINTCCSDTTCCEKCLNDHCVDMSVCRECDINNICSDCSYGCYGCSKGMCGECHDTTQAYEDGTYCAECREF